jgi:hypothetical protein
MKFGSVTENIGRGEVWGFIFIYLFIYSFIYCDNEFLKRGALLLS